MLSVEVENIVDNRSIVRVFKDGKLVFEEKYYCRVRVTDFCEGEWFVWEDCEPDFNNPQKPIDRIII